MRRVIWGRRDEEGRKKDRRIVRGRTYEEGERVRTFAKGWRRGCGPV